MVEYIVTYIKNGGGTEDLIVEANSSMEAKIKAKNFFKSKNFNTTSLKRNVEILGVRNRDLILDHSRK